MSDDQGQVIQEDSHEPSNFAMIPQMAIMELDPYELALYCNYKITARDSGACWKSNAKVALETGMSESKMRQTRLSLITKGYIQLTEQADESGNINTPPVITIVNIWSQNRSKYGVSENRGVAPENSPPATRKQGGSTRKHQSISNELDAPEVPISRKSAKASKIPTIPAEQMNPMKDALVEAFGWKWELMTQSEKGLIQVTAKELCTVNFAPDRVASLHAWCKAKFTDFSPRALVGHLSEYRAAQLNSASTAPIVPRKETMEEAKKRLGVTS